MLTPDYGPPRHDTADLGEPVPGPVWLEPWPDDEPVAEGHGSDPAAHVVSRAGRARQRGRAGAGGGVRRFKSFWPSMAGNPEASAATREISKIDNMIEKVVVSNTLTADETEPWRDTTRIVRRADAHAEIAELKERDGRDILVFGSRTLWNDLLQAGLVDQVHLMVGPSVLPGGTPALAQAPPGRMRLLGTRTLVGSDNVLMQYAVDPS